MSAIITLAVDDDSVEIGDEEYALTVNAVYDEESGALLLLVFTAHHLTNVDQYYELEIDDGSDDIIGVSPDGSEIVDVALCLRAWEMLQDKYTKRFIT